MKHFGALAKKFLGHVVERPVRLTFAAGSVLTLAACSGFSFGPEIGTRNIATPTPPPAAAAGQLPSAQGETIGNGPVRVALLLPLTGDLGSVGTSMANGARLAMDFIAQSPSVKDNITLVIKDTSGNPARASALASQAVSEGASLVLGPLRGDAVKAAGAVTSGAGVPLIGFSNTTSAAAPNVYLLNVLPENEIKRSLSFARANGRRSVAAIVPSTRFGQIQEAAFRKVAGEMGFNIAGVYAFGSQDEAQAAVEQLAPQIGAGTVDALFLPDRSTAPSIAVMMETAGIANNRVTILGSADWARDPKIQSTPYLVGALYPAVDTSGQALLRPDYVAKFGAEPHPLTSIAYTATLLANSSTLALATPRYDRGQLTRASGFNGRDGLFRFLPDGRSEYALVMNTVTTGGSRQVDAPKLPQ